MKYGAYAIVEVLGSANAVICVDQMLKTSDVHYLSKNTKCGGVTGTPPQNRGFTVRFPAWQ